MKRTLPLIAALLLSAAAFAQSTSVTKVAGQTVTFTWTAPTTNTDGSAISGSLTYSVYSCPSTATAGGAASACTAAVTGLSALTWTSAALTAGTFYYAVTASDANGQSALSDIATVTVTAAPPNAPSNFAGK